MPDSPPAAASPGVTGLSPRLKAGFIGLLLPFQLWVALHAGWALLSGGPPLAWLGALLPAAGLLGAMAAIGLGGRGRTSESLPVTLALSAAGLALVAAAGVAGDPLAPALAFGILSAAGNALYVFWYSRLGRVPSPLLAVGRRLPSFTLSDAEGRAVESDSLRGAPAVWLFYRGNWCPLCVAQVGEIAGLYREIEARGARVVLVSSQPQDKTRELARRFDAPMHFLVDRDARVARRLGLFHESGVPAGLSALGHGSDAVLPTALVTDADGKILFADQTDNYRVRPEPELFLRILDGESPA